MNEKAPDTSDFWRIDDPETAERAAYAEKTHQELALAAKKAGETELAEQALEKAKEDSVEYWRADHNRQASKELNEEAEDTKALVEMLREHAQHGLERDELTDLMGTHEYGSISPSMTREGYEATMGAVYVLSESIKALTKLAQTEYDSMHENGVADKLSDPTTTLGELLEITPHLLEDKAARLESRAQERLEDATVQDPEGSVEKAEN